MQQDKNSQERNTFPPAQTGNASNPSPQEGEATPVGNQLIDEKGEKYLREVAPVEDYPDEQDWKEADNTTENNQPTTGG